MKYNYETVETDCLIGLFFETGNNGTMQITQRINDSHYLCTIYYEGKPTGPKTIYSLNELGHFKLSTDIDGVE